MTQDQLDKINLVILGLQEATGGADVPDEYVVPGLQADVYREWVRLLREAIEPAGAI